MHTYFITKQQIIIQMDFLIDQRFFKSMKPLGIGFLAISSVIALAYSYNKLSQDEDSEQINQSKEQKAVRKPAGIVNEGNTCFVNSLLQALASLKLFINNIDELLEDADDIRKLNIQERLLLELRVSMAKINEGNQEESVDIVSYLNILGSFSNLVNLEQQDAHELFLTIVTCLEEVSNQRKYVSLNSSSLLGDKNAQLQQIEMGGRSIDNALLGYTKSSIKCNTCQIEQNIKIHPFYDLSLQISSREINTVQMALNCYQKAEIITDWVCTRCSLHNHIRKMDMATKFLTSQGKETKNNQDLIRIAHEIKQYCGSTLSQGDLDLSEVNSKLEGFVTKFMSEFEELAEHPKRGDVFCRVQDVKRTIMKQTIISKYPKILVIHLKQLSIDPYTGAPVLLRKPIQFPEKLEIKLRNKKKIYQLTSLLSHIGNESMGHYYSFRRLSGSDKQWFMISDTTSKACRWEYLSLSIPYMLFYELETEGQVQMPSMMRRSMREAPSNLENKEEEMHVKQSMSMSMRE